MHHNSTLTLLRSGALEQAEKEFFRLGLDGDTSSEDVMALKGRILKAKALERSGKARQKLALQAATAYEAAYTRFGGTFSGINTAAMLLIGGEAAKAQSTAKAIQAALKSSAPNPGVDAYYHMATVAEAWLILGEPARAQQALADAMPLDPHNYEAHASTLKQFEMLLRAMDQPIHWLDAFRPPKALHFAGHIFDLEGGKLPLSPSVVYGLEKAVDDVLASGSYGSAFGALAAGSDIIIAERLLAHGVDLHVVQPCPDALFAETSLNPFGHEWVPRFERLIKSATSVRRVSDDPSLCDDFTTGFASETAMDLAVLHADRFATTAEQMVIWNGESEQKHSGTARDADLWADLGRTQKVVYFDAPRVVSNLPEHQLRDRRSLNAMLFADVRGFGKLYESQLPTFVEHVFGALSACLTESGISPQHINTWGDGLFMVFEHLATAAEAATRLQAKFQGVNLSALGLPEDLALRIGAHYGPAVRLKDPFLGADGYFGHEVTAAARIEPVTSPGSIFVSEPFACALALRHSGEFRCEPLPQSVKSKNLHSFNLYSLRRIH